MKLSIVIPAYNEQESLPETLQTFYETLRNEAIDHEIVVVNDNSKDNTLQVLQKAFLVNVNADSVRHNQIKGKLITAFFKDGKLKNMFVDGNAESIYYAKDEHERLIGINKATSDIIDMRFKNKELNRVIFISEVNGTMLPFRQATEQDKKLRNFKWQEDRRPKSKFELFGN